MVSDGALYDTHVAAVRRGLADLPDETTLVGVVRGPPNGFRSAVDENRPSLAPPAAVHDEFERRYEEFKMRGMCAEGAHNAAWEAERVDDEYRSYVDADPEARAAVEDLVERLRSGERLALVCAAESANRRSHRTVLREYLAARA